MHIAGELCMREFNHKCPDLRSSDGLLQLSYISLVRLKVWLGLGVSHRAKIAQKRSVTNVRDVRWSLCTGIKRCKCFSSSRLYSFFAALSEDYVCCQVVVGLYMYLCFDSIPSYQIIPNYQYSLNWPWPTRMS